MTETVKVQSAYIGIPSVSILPTNLMKAGILSSTSSAPECFINQRFSSKLQAFLIDYVNSISSDYSILGV